MNCERKFQIFGDVSASQESLHHAQVDLIHCNHSDGFHWDQNNQSADHFKHRQSKCDNRCHGRFACHVTCNV